MKNRMKTVPAWGMKAAILCAFSAVTAFAPLHSPITAGAAEQTAVLDDNGVLRLRGRVVLDEVKAICKNPAVERVECEPGTVFPVDCTGMFTDCTAESYDFSNADTSQTVWMHGMFCHISAKELDLSGFDTSSAWDMGCLFADSPIETLNLSGFDTRNVTTMSEMFANMPCLKKLDLSSFDTPALTETMMMFYNDTALEEIHVSPKWNVSKVPHEGGRAMFYQCTGLCGENGNSFNPEFIDAECADLFCAGGSDVPCYLILDDPGSSAILNADGILLLNGDVNSMDLAQYRDNNANIKKIVCAADTVLPEDCKYLFSRIPAETIDLSRADWSKVKSAYYMFGDCEKLTAIRYPSEGKAAPDSAEGLFSGCASLPAADLSFWDLSGTENLGGMFRDCRSLVRIDLSGVKVSADLAAYEMFRNCGALTRIILPDSAWNLTDTAGMFENCSSLETVSLSNCSTAKVRRMANMFRNCSALTTIYVSDLWSTVRVTDSGSGMFAGCTALIGGAGTQCTELSDISCRSACIDDPDLRQPGYLTRSVRSGQHSGLSAVSVTLTDGLYLNFYADGVTAADRSDYKVVFDNGGAPENKNTDVPLTEKNGRYCASALIPAHRASEPFDVMLYKRNGDAWEAVASCRYSLTEYLNHAEPEAGWSAEKKEAFNNLIGTVRQYCEQAYLYFLDVKTPAVKDYSADILNNELNPGFVPSFTSDQATISLVMNAKTAFRMYFRGLKRGETAMCGNQVLNAQLNTNAGGVNTRGGCYFFEIKDIMPTALGRPLTVTYKGTDYTLAPLSWAYRVMTANKPENYYEWFNYIEYDVKIANTLYEYYLNANAFAALS